jgi:hypothetical protein
MLQKSWSDDKNSYSQSYCIVTYKYRDNLRTENHKYYLTSLATFVELSTATEEVPVLIVYIGP